MSKLAFNSVCVSVVLIHLSLSWGARLVDSPLRDVFTMFSFAPGLFALECLEETEISGLGKRVQHLHVHVGVVLVVLFGNVRVPGPALESADTALDAPALLSAYEVVVVPACAGPGRAALGRFAYEQPVAVAEGVSGVPVDDDKMAHHGVLMAIESGVEFRERGFENSEAVPAGSGRTEHRDDVFGEDAVEQVPLVGVECEGIEIDDLDDLGFVVVGHACSPRL